MDILISYEGKNPRIKFISKRMFQKIIIYLYGLIDIKK